MSTIEMTVTARTYRELQAEIKELEAQADALKQSMIREMDSRQASAICQGGRITMGYKIKEAQEAQKMTQEELAEKSGISRTAISQLESGEERVTTTTILLAISQALGVSIEQMFFY